MKDACAVGVVQNLLSESRKGFAEQIAAEYEEVRAKHGAQVPHQADHAGESAFQQDENRLGGVRPPKPAP